MGQGVSTDTDDCFTLVWEDVSAKRIMVCDVYEYEQRDIQSGY